MSNIVKYASYEMLSKEDQRILNDWESADLPGLNVTQSVKAFQMYLDGISPRQMVAVDPNLQLGSIIKTLVTDSWVRPSCGDNERTIHRGNSSFEICTLKKFVIR